jgi:hypothetical protein
VQCREKFHKGLGHHPLAVNAAAGSLVTAAAARTLLLLLRNAQVTFNLHPSFKDPVRKAEQQPYELTETGWGEFDIGVVVRHTPSSSSSSSSGGGGSSSSSSTLISASPTYACLQLHFARYAAEKHLHICCWPYTGHIHTSSVLFVPAACTQLHFTPDAGEKVVDLHCGPVTVTWTPYLSCCCLLCMYAAALHS